MACYSLTSMKLGHAAARMLQLCQLPPALKPAKPYPAAASAHSAYGCYPQHTVLIYPVS
jgi:hypothetical protein